MSRYYTKNAYSPGGVTVAHGAQPAEHEIAPETKSDTEEPDYATHDQEGRKCYGCSIMLKDTREYIIDWIGQGFQAFCHQCRNK